MPQVLSSGEEVRLQRNALSVVEHPTGLESVSIGIVCWTVNLKLKGLHLGTLYRIVAAGHGLPPPGGPVVCADVTDRIYVRAGLLGYGGLEPCKSGTR